MKLLKRFFIVCTVCFFAMPLTALPGIKDFLPTENGQFVYYRDYTFSYEAYIGFLQYDASTYAIRYFAKSPAKGLPIIELILTLNTDSDFIEITGEKIVSKVTNNDIDIMNYMHDMLYELSARRKKVNNETVTTHVKSFEEYLQFGGNVHLFYNPIVPLFNLQTIKDSDKNILLEAVMIGKITNESDFAWSHFFGTPHTLPEVYTYNEKQVNNLTQKGFTTIDNQWEQIMDNFFLLDDNALMFETEVQTKEYFSLLRAFSLSDNNKTVYFKNQTIKTTNDGSIILSNLINDNQTKEYQQDIKILSAIDKGSCKITGLTVFDGFFQSNKDYFNMLIKNNSTEKVKNRAD
ncbi:MAG TPA: hypothetical protein VFC68_00975 [Treponemataceae bacterium]|nr:hypothetical protein [Treponemataceae bacterium]